MSAIDLQNALQIRDPMQISCGIAARPNINLTFADLSGFVVADTNPSASLDAEEWPVIEITDLQGDGFPLDGSCSFYVAGEGSETGKLGARTHIGGTGSLTVSSTQEIPALTIYTKGEGTLTAGGVEYELRGVNVIPVNSTSISLTFESTDDERRVGVESIIPGISLAWDNDTLISVELDLRSDLSIDNSQWAVSEIEIHAYYPDDISESVSSIADDVPIWYSAGYPGDMSPDRRFYLAEPVTMENGIITIRGHDASYKLSETANAAQILNTKSGTGRYDLYVMLMHFIQDAGITLRSKESAPAKTSGTTERSLIFKSNTTDKIVQHIMNLAHTGTYWPTFVDAGIPKLTHTKPTTAKWDIYEEDCGDVKRIADRNVSRIVSHDEYGLHSRVVRSDNAQEIVRRKVTADTRYSQNAGGYFWKLSVSNAKDISVTAESIWWTAVEDTTGRPVMTYAVNIETGETTRHEEIIYVNESVVVGKAASITSLANAVTPEVKRAGTTMVAEPISYGQVFTENVFLYPNYNYLFNRSNITGGFLWKGDPRMQPRDVFNFHRLDGTVDLCTIETIVLRHEEGGTTAEITYRLGVC